MFDPVAKTLTFKDIAKVMSTRTYSGQYMSYHRSICHFFNFLLTHVLPGAGTANVRGCKVSIPTVRLHIISKTKTVFQGQLKCPKNGFDPRKFKHPAVFIKIQPFLELNSPEILLNCPNCGGIS